MSNGSNKNYIGDNYLRPDGCGPSTCTHVTKDGSNTAWISLELDYTKGDFGISTIVFLADRNQNIDGFGNMRRFYGPNSDPFSLENTEIIQSGGTNYPSIIADLNNCGPVMGNDIRYIHWVSDEDFDIAEILCYNYRRLVQDEITEIFDYYP